VVKEAPDASEAEVAHAQARLEAASASRRYVSESTRASRLYWWTAEYGLIGNLEQPRIYGAGLLSSIGEAKHCLTDAVKKLPLGVSCADTDYDITRMQPQLFVARDFEHLFEVLAEFEASLAWKRGGDYGLAEAQRARSVNHLVLADGREVTGRVLETLAAPRPVAPGLSAALVRMDGPILASRDGKAEAGKPWNGPALVAFGAGTLPEKGPFKLVLDSGLVLEGFAAGGGEVLALEGQLEGRELALPTVAKLYVSTHLPSVAGGPADPEAWDHWFGELSAFSEGDGESKARARKAMALHPSLAALYREVRNLREKGGAKPERLAQIAAAATDFPGDWLLRTEVEELRGR